jgi:ATP-binding cassette subfamily F protein 3
LWSEALIFLTNVAKFYGGKPLFRQATVGVHRGDRIGIVGPNGAGKSTILGMMEGAISPDEGEVSVEKGIRKGVLHQELILGNEVPILEEVMNVSDELRSAKERLSQLEHEMAVLSEDSPHMQAMIEELGHVQHEFERFGGYTLEARALKVLAGLGFQPEDAHRPWGQFSGGWRMRVVLAKILLAEPDVLLLDEPTNYLDLESLLWVETYLTTYKGAIVLVSHDRAFLNKIVTRIVEVDRGRVTSYTGDYDDFERTKTMQEGVILSAYKSQQEKIKRIQKFIDQNRVKARSASRVQSRVKMLEKMERVEPPPKSKTVKFSFPQPPHSGRRVLEIDGLAKRYGPLTVYESFTFALERGDRVGLVGPNGAGKSTLLKIMAGILAYDEGSVKYGHMVEPGYFAQHQYESLNSARSVLQEAYSVSPSLTEQEVRNLLGAFLFSGDDVYKKVSVLSGGEKSRLALVKILLAPPNLLLMDEPTNHLDIPSCEILEDALRSFRGTLVLITHDRRLMNSICTGMLEIQKGSAEFYHGSYEDYRYKKGLMEQQRAQEDPAEPETPSARQEPLRGSRKEKRRREAETRSALFKQQAPIKRKIQQIETELHTKEARKREIEALMADPAIYEEKSKILPLLEEDPILGKEIKELESKWEELQTRLDELENGFGGAS